MKFLFFLILIVCYSCDDQIKPKPKLAAGADWTKFSNIDNPILGNWSMCAQSFSGQYIMFNQCLTMVFSIDGLGTIIKSDGHDEVFKWNIEKGVLIINPYTNDPNFLFPDTNYIAGFSPNGELEIRHQTKNYSYYLHKKL